MKTMKKSFYVILVASSVLASCGSKQPAVATPAPVTNAAKDAPATEAATSLEESPNDTGGENQYKMQKPEPSVPGSACVQAGGSCVSQMATVACASQPPNLCAAAEICCVMAKAK